MADWFLDSSAIVKRYLRETGTNWVRTIIDPAGGNRAFLARITGAEVVAAIARRTRGAAISPADAAAIISAFRRDFADEFWILEILPSVVSRAMALAERHGLRGYDAIQLATALEDRVHRLSGGVPPLTFISADQALNAAAQAEGFLVDDPNAHS